LFVNFLFPYTYKPQNIRCRQVIKEHNCRINFGELAAMLKIVIILCAAFVAGGLLTGIVCHRNNLLCRRPAVQQRQRKDAVRDIRHAAGSVALYETV
jgi:hypothetical protein